jgi:hypothetical protein
MMARVRYCARKHVFFQINIHFSIQANHANTLDSHKRACNTSQIQDPHCVILVGLNFCRQTVERLPLYFKSF